MPSGGRILGKYAAGLLGKRVCILFSEERDIWGRSKVNAQEARLALENLPIAWRRHRAIIVPRALDSREACAFSKQTDVRRRDSAENEI